MNRAKPYYEYSDIILFKEQLIDTWRPTSDVWALKYGDEILSFFSGFGGFFATYIFRKELKVRPFARLTCYSPVMGVSAIGCFLFQSMIISTDILRSRKCPVCVATKSSIFQTVFSVVYPAVGASVACIYMADKLLTYPVPPLLKAPREVFQLFQKIIRKNPRPFLVIGGLNIIAASFITYQKHKNLWTLELKTRRPEDVLRN